MAKFSAGDARSLGSLILVFVFITLPWLNPFSPGPTPAVMPWLVSLGSFTMVLLWGARVPLAQVAACSWLAAALLSAAFGLLQYFGAAALFSPWIDSTAVGEAFGNLRQRNQFATLTNIGLAALLWWRVQGQASITAEAVLVQSKRLDWRALAALTAAVLLALGNAASSSRTGLVQLVLLTAMVGWWQRGRLGWAQSAQLRLLLAALMAYVVAAFALPTLVGHDLASSGILARLHDGGPQCASRLTLWRNVLYLIGQKPWFGWGWGELDFAHFITLYPGSRFCEILDNAHNLPLHLAVELGLPVALLVCGAGLWLTLRARPWRESDATRQLAWAVLAVILLHSLLEYPLWYGPFQMAFGLSLWLIWRRPGRLPVGVTAGAKGLAIGLIVIVSYAAWDYERIGQIYLTPSMRSPAYREDTLTKIGNSWLFQSQVDFAELTTTDLTSANASHVNRLAKAMLHFSPEPRVIEKVIESAWLMGHADEARFYQRRYRAAFAESYARWSQAANLPAFVESAEP